ncbi:MAG: 1-deoxy-D-xylulose-5-phosphate synthase [Acidobacteria bacterium]|nr:1-deoxy-D-xylulose-5-phosphate synthase [Acidobacteriota bacterium]
MLETIDSPADLKKLSLEDLEPLASEIRDRMIEVVSKNGGHLASNLGVVELTLALHYVFDTPRDKILWDVSHQCYTHKLITGRRDAFHTLRTYQGITGFCNRQESPHDAFTAGHASTSISAALGMAVGRDMARRDNRVVAVIGDGSLTGGMAMEGLNQAGHRRNNLLIVLNDNEMSISSNVGAWSGYLKRIIDGQVYTVFARDVQAVLRSIPGIGNQLLKTTKNLVDAIKTFFVPGKLLEELGLRYLGPVDGHNVPKLVETFREIRDMEGPVLLHVVTTKGKGYAPAEKEPDKWHGASPFNVATGKGLRSGGPPTYTAVFSETLRELARTDDRLVAVSAAMLSGTGLDAFKRAYPDRCFDVGIAEQHAVTFSAGMATEGYHPVVAIYSTFLQRAFDQVFHDVCLMNLPVTFVLDRAGIVGDDGPTHHGLYDLAYLRILPNMTVMAPKDEAELRDMLLTATRLDGPAAIRFPRGAGEEVSLEGPPREVPVGKGEVLRTGKDVALIAIGSRVHPALKAAETLSRKGIECTVVNARFAKPLDRDLIRQAAEGRLVVTVEEGILPGGFGAAVTEFLQDDNVFTQGILRMGLPDRVIPHGDPRILLARYRLDAEGIAERVAEFFEERRWPRNDSTVCWLNEDWRKRASKPRP